MLIALALVTSCGGRKPLSPKPSYHQFQTVDTKGWQRADTLLFTIPAADSAATLQLQVQVRALHAYPFQNLVLQTSVNHEQTRQTTFTIHPKAGAETPEQTTLSPTYIDATADIATVTTTPNQSTEVRIAHHMEANPLPGIANIGVRAVEK